MSSPISGFTAIPNPQMLAFMPIQSYLMMYFAGAGWQIGKRKVSAIPNDKFNPMSAKDLLEGFTADLRDTIPTLERSLKDITPLIAVLIDQYGDFIIEALKVLPKTAEKVGGAVGKGLFDVGEGSLLDIILHRIEEDKKANPPKGGNLAYAHEQSIITEGLEEFENTKAKREAIQAKENARVIRLQELLYAKEQAEARKDIRAITPQLSRSFTRKRPAGQSQKLEKTKLIKQIKDWQVTDRRLKGSGSTGRKIRKLIRQHKQLLANLLARYQF